MQEVVEAATRAASRFRKKIKFPIDENDVLGEATLIAWKLVNRFDGRGKLTGFLYVQTLRKLYGLWYHQQEWRRKIVNRIGMDLFDGPTKSRFDLDKLLLEVSDKAAEAILIAIDVGGPGIHRTVNARRNDVITALRERFEWDDVIKVFREVREAL